MAEGTYEFEEMRAELLGIKPPDKSEFEKARSERLEVEKAERDAAEANLLENQDESMKATGGKMEELNSILSSTQSKINRLKQSARGSLSNIFSRGNTLDESGNRRDSADNHNDNYESLPNLDDVNKATKVASDASVDISMKMSSHLDKLDSLISKAEQAEISMSEQKKEMRRMVPK